MMGWVKLIEEKSLEPLVKPDSLTQQDLQDMYNALFERYRQSKAEPWYIQKTEEFNNLLKEEVDKLMIEIMERDLDNSKS